MDKADQIAILLAIAAIPVGVALMTAPDYVSALKTHPGLFFWGGIIAASALILTALVIAIRRDDGVPRVAHGQSAIFLIGMIVCGIGFLGFAGAYFWPSVSRSEELPATSPVPHAELPSPSQADEPNGSVGVRIEGGSNITIEDNYFGKGISTGIDARNANNLRASGNIHEPEGPKAELPAQRLPQFSLISDAGLQKFVVDFCGSLRSFEAKSEGETTRILQDNWRSNVSTEQERDARWTQMNQKLDAHRREVSQEYLDKYYSKASDYYTELRARLQIKELSNIPALDHRMLAGAHPMTEAAAYLEALAVRLPIAEAAKSPTASHHSPAPPGSQTGNEPKR